MSNVHFEIYAGRLSIWADIPHDEFLEMHGDAETDGAELFSRFASAHNDRLLEQNPYMGKSERVQKIVQAWFDWRARLGIECCGIYGEGEPTPFCQLNEDTVTDGEYGGLYVTERYEHGGPMTHTIINEYIIHTSNGYGSCHPELIEANGRSELGLLFYNDASLHCPACHAYASSSEGYVLTESEAPYTRLQLTTSFKPVLCERLPTGHVKPGIIYIDTNDDTKALCPHCGNAELEGGL